MDEIVNKVANSSLVVFDLEDYYPIEKQSKIDISCWLFEGIIVKEKDFRTQLSQYDWAKHQYENVAIFCSTEAIVPAWAFILVAIQLTPFANRIINGTLEDLDSVLYQEILSKVDFSIYEGKSIILKGCSKKPVPMSAYVLAAQYLQPFAKSIMYGEACSAVPLFKKK
jgi:hypothetical protein